MAKVSICIPTYNQTEYLKKCIQSVFEQDYKDFEIIISDDSSSNDVKHYIELLKSEQPLHYFRNNPALGTPENWNHAITKASGEYIKILHHDDFLNQPNSLRLFVESLENNPKSDFAFSSTLVWHVDTGLKRIHSCNHKKLERLNQHPEYLFFSNLVGAPSATIYRKSLNIKFDKRLKWLVDIDFYIAALKHNKHFVYINQPLICTAHGAEGQVTQQVEYDKTIQIKEHILLLEKIISRKELTKLYLKFFDELFLQYHIYKRSDVENYVEIPSNLDVFLNDVFSHLKSFKTLKKIKYRLLNSKYNRRYFKIEKF